MEKVCLFVSIELPDEIRRVLVNVQKKIKDSQSVLGTFVQPDQLHITLAFMGHANEGAVYDIIGALKTVPFTSFLIDLPNVELIPNQTKPELIWAQVRSSDLDELSIHVYDLLKPYGVDEKEFVGHVTLMRVKEIKSSDSLKSLMSSVNPLNLTFRAERMALNKSEMHSGGLVHIQLAEFRTVEELVEE